MYDTLSSYSKWLSPTTVLLATTVTLFTTWVLDLRHSRRMPPGPFQWPFIGCLPQIIGHAQNPIAYFQGLGTKYKGIFSVKMGSIHTVFISDYEVMKEVLVNHADCFSNRKMDILPAKIMMQYKGAYGVLYNNGEKWKHLRRFAVMAMRDMGVGKKTLEERIQQEAQALCTELAKHADNPCEPGTTIGIAVTNIICSIIFGDRYEYGDADFKKIISSTNEAAGLLPFIDLYTLLKPLQMLPRPQKFIRFTELREELMSIVVKQIKRHEESFDGNNIRDLIDLCLQKQGMSEEDEVIFTGNALCQVVFDLFLAGAETTSTTLRWALLYLIDHPEVQEKCHMEIESVLGDKMVLMAHRPNLPYVEAAIAEVQRITTIVPFSVPHGTAYDTTVRGYRIPKGTWIFPMLYAVNMDPELWNDPHVFKPERFLDESGQFCRQEHLVPFSLGPRLCAGEPLARMELFLFFTTLVQKFKFSKVSPDQVIDYSPVVGITQSPRPQPIKINIC